MISVSFFDSFFPSLSLSVPSLELVHVRLHATAGEHVIMQWSAIVTFYMDRVKLRCRCKWAAQVALGQDSETDLDARDRM